MLNSKTDWFNQYLQLANDELVWEIGDTIRFGCVSFELKVRLLSGKVCLPKPLQERNHDFQLTRDYTLYSCRA